MFSSLLSQNLEAIVVFLVAVVIGLAVLTFYLHRRLSSALGGQSGSLEATVQKSHQLSGQVQKDLTALAGLVEKLQAQANVASQKISVVRFNPFGDTGGDQSFSLAVLDAHSSGYVLTSIHGRQGTRVYVKPIDYGKSRYKLSEEEQRALLQASKRVPQEG